MKKTYYIKSKVSNLVNIFFVLPKAQIYSFLLSKKCSPSHPPVLFSCFFLFNRLCSAASLASDPTSDAGVAGGKSIIE